MVRPYLSVIIPAYNEAALLEHCLTSLRSQTTERPFEIIIVDNGSSDDTAAIARRLEVQVVSEPTKGVCAARQAGFLAANGEVVVSSDADCVYPAGWLAAIERRFSSQPDVSVLVGTYRFDDAPLPNRLLGAWERLALRLHFAFGWQLYVSAANLAFRASLFDGYDTRRGSGGDELYVVNQVRRRGRIAFELHNPVQTSARRLRGRFFVALVRDFGVNYLAAYLVARSGSHATDIRDEHDQPPIWPQILLAIALILLTGLVLIGLIYAIATILSALPNRPRTYIGLAALAAGGLAYCTFWPTSQLVLPAPWRVRTRDKLVALTFDDGPNEPYTSRIAAIIESYGGVATFFQCGAMVERAPEVTRRLVAAGHTIGNHSYNHAFSTQWRPRRLLTELRRTTAILERNGVHLVRFVRMPWLIKTPMAAWAIRRCGLTPVAGRFVALREVSQPDGATMARRCLASITPGSIVILHDSRETYGGDRTQTVRAVAVLCRELTARGYRFVAIDELI